MIFGPKSKDIEKGRVDDKKRRVDDKKRRVDNKKRVCFTCFTQSNLFNAYILSKTVYKNDYKILILSDINLKYAYHKIIKECCIWDEVILISEAGRMEREQRLDMIRPQLEKIDFNNIDILHYFALNQNSFVCILFDYIPDKTKIIQTVFTAATYYVKEYYLYAKEIYKKLNININVDYDRISEIWLYDNRLHIGKLLKRPIRNIEIAEYITDKKLLNEFCDELNKIFHYNHRSMDYDVIFLDQPIAPKLLKKQDEKKLFSKILNEFNKFNVLVKNHIRSSQEKYKEFNVSIIEENKVPWEVILLNELNMENLNNKIFVTYFSDTIVTTHMVLNKLNIPHSSIRLNGILEKYTKNQTGDDRYKIFFERFKTLYRKNYYDIESIDELTNILKSLR